MVALSPTTSPVCAAFARAFDRAKAEKLVAFRIDANTWECKTYLLRVFGARAQDVTCNCEAGARGRICKHLAVVTFCRKHGVYPIRPVDTYAARAAHLAATGLDPLWDAFN